MAEYTIYKSLELPLAAERYDIGVFNRNNQIIDSELHKLDLKNQSQDELLATKATDNIDGLLSKEDHAKFSKAALGLQINNEPVYLDCQDGKYGFNTDPERGADTFVPFKSDDSNDNSGESSEFSKIMLIGTYEGSQSIYVTKYQEMYNNSLTEDNFLIEVIRGSGGNAEIINPKIQCGCANTTFSLTKTFLNNKTLSISANYGLILRDSAGGTNLKQISDRLMYNLYLKI